MAPCRHAEFHCSQPIRQHHVNGRFFGGEIRVRGFANMLRALLAVRSRLHDDALRKRKLYLDVHCLIVEQFNVKLKCRVPALGILEQFRLVYAQPPQ